MPVWPEIMPREAEGKGLTKITLLDCRNVARLLTVPVTVRRARRAQTNMLALFTG
jgi:hypothetical protein